MMQILTEPFLEAFTTIMIEEKPMPQPKLAMASTYVQISRDDLEQWLDTLHLHSKWHLVPNKAGIYLLPLSDTVGVKLSSTIGSRDDAMGRGQASMQLALISLITGQVLNKKAQGQNHFARTTNWKLNWKVGIERMRETYLKSQGFYDALAEIEDREQYKIDILKRIESNPEWRNNQILADFHDRALKGGVLTGKQIELMERLTPLKPTPAPVSVQVEPQRDEELYQRSRKLFQEATRSHDTWLEGFLRSVGPKLRDGIALSPRQLEVLDQNLGKYKVAVYRAAIRKASRDSKLHL
jgi:hypothetical protein